MEATEKKKKRNGGYYLKEKIAKLEAENKELQKLKEASDKIAEHWKNKYNAKSEELAKAEAERDSWHSKYTNEHGFHVEAAEKRRDAVERLEFVMEHCGPYLRWLYRKQFGK